MPYKRKDGNQKKPWVGQIIQNGKAKRATFATKKEALAWESEQVKACVLLTPTISLGELAIKYLDFAKSKFVRKTYLEKVAVFRMFFKLIDRTLLACQLSPGMVLSYLRVQNDSRSGYAANKDRKNLAASWVWGSRYLDGFPQMPNPFLAVEKFAQIRKGRYVPPEADFWAAYHACRNDMDKALLLTFLHTGARRGELFRLIWSDVDFHNRTIRLQTRKNRLGTWEESRLPMTDDLHQALSALASSNSTDFVFSREGGIQFSCRVHFLKRVCRRAGVKAFGFHAIRHLTASILATSGVPMVHIQAILRHKNLATTERYIRGLESVRASLSFLPGVTPKQEVMEQKPPQKPPEIKKAVSNKS